MREFTIGGVVRQTLDLIGRHAGFLVVLSLILVGVPRLIGAAIAASAISGNETPWVALWGFLPIALGFIGGMVLQVAVVRTAVLSANNRVATLGESLAAAAGLFFPVLAISLLSGIATGLAAILLIFPAIMLACRWVVAVPTEVIERPGIMASFSRSAALTKGLRWQIFGLLIIFAIVGLVASGVAGLVARVVATPDGINWLAIVLDVVVTSLSGIVSAVGVAAIYLQLRGVKEGALSQDLVSVFD